MKKTILKILLTMFAVGALIGTIILVKQATTAKSDGTVTVEYVSVEGEVIKSKEIAYYEGDTLVQLIQENFENVVIEEGMIMTFEDYTTPSDWSTFISIEVNGEQSMLGIKDIPLADGMNVSLIITIYE